VKRQPAAVVVGVGGPAGVSAIRLLGRRGIRVFAVDHRRSPLGFRSRYAIPWRVPDPERDEPGFARALASLADAIGEPVPIFPCRDEDLNALARNGETLAARFFSPFPSWEQLQPLQQKRFQVRRAAELGLAVPATTSDAATVRSFPVLIKPSRPQGFRRRFGVQALRCGNRSELKRCFALARPFDPIAQELIPGSDRTLFTLGAYIDRPGEPPTAIFCGRKLRQTPPEVGTCRVGEACWDDRVVEQGLKLLRGLEFAGIAQVEFKYDERDDTFKFIEVNLRLWQWHENAAVCGADLAWVAYRASTGQAVDPVTSRGCRRRWALTFADSLAPALTRLPYVDPLLPRDDARLAATHLARAGRNTLARAKR